MDNKYSERYNYIVSHENIELIENLTHGKITILFYNQKITVNYDSFYKKLCNYDECVILAKLNHDDILRTFYDNTHICLQIKNKFGEIFTKNTCLYKKMINYRAKFEKHVQENGHTLMSGYINAKDLVLIDFNCGHPAHRLSPNVYDSGVRCPYCAHQKILSQVNDCYALRPDLLKYFINTDDAIGIPVYDKKYRTYKCPNCGSLKRTTLSNIVSFGFSCNICGDGISYPEKFISGVLDQLGQSYKIHHKFNWSKYIFNNKEHDGYYDFVLFDKKIIIEADGKLHFIYNDMNKQTSEESQYIDKQKQDKAIKHGYKVIRINCYYTTTNDRFNILKKGVIEQLSNLFDLSYIDWKKIDRDCLTSKMISACELWNRGYMIKDIIRELHTNNNSVLQYLKTGSKSGICNYSKQESMRRKGKYYASKYYRYIAAYWNDDNKLIGVFYNPDEFILMMLNKYNIKLKRTSIYAIIKSDKKNTLNGIQFKEITLQEFNQVKEDNPKMVYGDYYFFEENYQSSVLKVV